MDLNFNIYYGPDAALTLASNKEVLQKILSGATYSTLEDAKTVMNTFEEINRLFDIKANKEITTNIYLFRKNVKIPDISIIDSERYIITLSEKSTRITAIEAYSDMIFRLLFKGTTPHFLTEIKQNMKANIPVEQFDCSNWTERNTFVRMFSLAILNSMIDEESIEFVNSYNSMNFYVPHPIDKVVSFADFSEIFINLMIKSVNEGKLTYQDSVDKILWQNGKVAADFFKIPCENGILSSKNN